LQGYGTQNRSIGGAYGWNANMLYINGWNDWNSGVSIGGSGHNSNLIVTGNVGIGTMTPTQQLDVVGYIKGAKWFMHRL